jgi:uncharacterized membrane protein
MPPKGLMRSHRLFLILLGSWIAVFCGLKTLQHFSFGTNACDLSIVDYGFSSTLKGEVMADPFHQYAFGRWDRSPGTLAYVPGRVKGWESHFAVHFTPILFLFIPFYIVFPGPLVLLYIEVLAVGLSAMFLFLIARDVFKDKLLPVIVAVIYLFFRQVLIGVMHDFHTESLFPVLVLGGYYFLAIREKHLPAFLFFSLALLVREDIGIYLFFLGIFVMFKLKKRNPGLLLSAAGLGYALLALGLIIPFFRHQSGATGFYVYGATYGQESGSLFQLVGHIISHPGLLFQGVDLGAFLKVSVLGILFLLLFLPLLSSYGLLLIPPVAVMLLSKIPQMYTFGIHYGMTVLPFLFLAFIYGLKNVRDVWCARVPGKAPRGILFLALVMMMANLANSSIWRIVQPARYKAIATYSAVKELMNQIPPEASVAAQSALIPHLPKRRAIEMLPAFNGDEYVLVHRGVNLWPYTKEEFDNFLKALDINNAYDLIGRRGEARLYKRKK